MPFTYVSREAETSFTPFLKMLLSQGGISTNPSPMLRYVVMELGENSQDYGFLTTVQGHFLALSESTLWVLNLPHHDRKLFPTTFNRLQKFCAEFPDRVQGIPVSGADLLDDLYDLITTGAELPSNVSQISICEDWGFGNKARVFKAESHTALEGTFDSLWVDPEKRFSNVLCHTPQTIPHPEVVAKLQFKILVSLGLCPSKSPNLYYTELQSLRGNSVEGFSGYFRARVGSRHASMRCHRLSIEVLPQAKLQVSTSLDPVPRIIAAKEFQDIFRVSFGKDDVAIKANPQYVMFVRYLHTSPRDRSRFAQGILQALAV